MKSLPSPRFALPASARMVPEAMLLDRKPPLITTWTSSAFTNSLAQAMWDSTTSPAPQTSNSMGCPLAPPSSVLK